MNKSLPVTLAQESLRFVVIDRSMISHFNFQVCSDKMDLMTLLSKAKMPIDTVSIQQARSESSAVEEKSGKGFVKLKLWELKVGKPQRSRS